MDAVKLKNSCICGNTLPYAECCGVYAPGASRSVSDEGRAAFRRDLHDLSMYLFPLRNLYQAYWERLSQEEYPHHLLMADPDYGRAVMANFFWDYSVQFSDARPILRAARDVEEKNLRLANDFRQWSLAPFWLWRVVSSDAASAHVRMPDGGRTLRVIHGGELPEPGRLFAGRVVPHRNRLHVHPAVLSLPEGSEESALARLRGVCRDLGIKSGAGLRPDVQCEEWRRHGSLVLAVWRAAAYDAHVGLPARTMATPQVFRVPAGEGGAFRLSRLLGDGGAVPLDPARFDLRHRALTLARLEIESDGWLRVTLLDTAYRARVFRWLADHFDAASAVGAGADDAVDGAALAALAGLSGSGTWGAWARAAHEALNGESPLEASRHDFGRRRLEDLLTRLTIKEDEMSALRRDLGL